MVLPVGTLADPALDQTGLAWCECELRVRGWHALIGILGDDPAVELTGSCLARRDNRDIVVLGEQAGTRIETEIGLALRLVWAMTVVAQVREDRADVPVELDLCG